MLATSSQDEFTTPIAIVAVAFFAAIIAVVAIVVWLALGIYRARMSSAREESYRAVTQDLSRFQSRIADSLERNESELREVRQRLAEVERLLKEVG
jgi:nitrogen fixation protein FixH